MSHQMIYKIIHLGKLKYCKIQIRILFLYMQRHFFRQFRMIMTIYLLLIIKSYVLQPSGMTAE